MSGRTTPRIESYTTPLPHRDGYAIAARFEQVSDAALFLNMGTPIPA